MAVAAIQDRIALDGTSEARHLLMERLHEKGVEILLQATATAAEVGRRI